MSGWRPGAAVVEEGLRRGSVQSVAVNTSLARELLASARNHLSSAASVVAEDPEGAYALAYDAARKAATALLAVQGLRVRAVRGHHAIVANVAAAQFGDRFERLEPMRRLRNRTEYPDPDRPAAAIDTTEAATGLQWATAIVEAAESLIEGGQLGAFTSVR